MQNHPREVRILAFDVRAKSLAYAAFEGPGQLLDFGVSGSAVTGFHSSRVEKLARKFQPDVIVLRKLAPGSSRDNPGMRAAIKSIRVTVRGLNIPIVFIEKRQIDETFRRDARTTKDRIAVLLGGSFPALTWYVPRKRKPYMPEDRRMHYFDAAALGLTYFATEGDAETVKHLLSEAESRNASTPDKPSVPLFNRIPLDS